MAKEKDSPTPVTGADLEFFRTANTLTIAEMCHIFGVTRPRWNELIRHPGPVKDTGIAVLIRAYEKSPDLIPVARKPDMQKAFDAVRESAKRHGVEMDRRRFARLLRRREAATYRWLDEDRSTRGTSTVVERLAEIALQVPDPYEFLLSLGAAEDRARARLSADAKGVRGSSKAAK